MAQRSPQVGDVFSISIPKMALHFSIQIYLTLFDMGIYIYANIFDVISNICHQLDVILLLSLWLERLSCGGWEWTFAVDGVRLGENIAWPLSLLQGSGTGFHISFY